MKGWTPTTIGNLCKVKHGWAFKGEYFADEGKYFLLTPGNFHESGGLKLKAGKEKYYSGDFPKEYLLEKGNLLVVMTDLIQSAPILGGSALVPQEDKFLHNQRLGKVIDINEDMTTKDFLYWLFNFEGYRSQIRGSASGATVRHTAPERIYRCKVMLPPLAAQKKIALTLSAYNNLIENNLKRIKLLEEMAQITYEEWFVRLRFPNYESIPINPEAGLPEGWSKIRLGEMCTLTMGQSPKSEFYNFEGTGLPFHQGVKDYGERFPTNACWSTSGSRYAERGDILFSVRAPVGRLNIALEKMILGRGLAAIRHKDNAQGFLYCLLKKQFFEEDMMGGGAIFNSVTKNDMHRIEVVAPSKAVLNDFNEIVEATDRQIEILHYQNVRLREARDILLPRLMTGVIDAENYNPADLLKEAA